MRTATYVKREHGDIGVSIVDVVDNRHCCFSRPVSFSWYPVLATLQLLRIALFGVDHVYNLEIEGLGFIRDMHRLLSYKGYVFPAVRREDAAVLNSSDVSIYLVCWPGMT